uniref:Uncharacterized protein n=1 Tax=Ditylenchus dipsaci TaxID=166011 RepID=A0A915CVD2_9BILA
MDCTIEQKVSFGYMESRNKSKSSTERSLEGTQLRQQKNQFTTGGLRCSKLEASTEGRKWIRTELREAAVLPNSGRMSMQAQEALVDKKGCRLQAQFNEFSRKSGFILTRCYAKN